MDTLQAIQTKRGLYEKKRRKRWLWFKNRGLQEMYFDRFKVYNIPIPPVIKLAWWRKVIINIQKFLYNLFKN